MHMTSNLMKFLETETMQMPNVKQEARHLVESLPESATWDDLMYTIYVRQAIEPDSKIAKPVGY